MAERPRTQHCRHAFRLFDDREPEAVGHAVGEPGLESDRAGIRGQEPAVVIEQAPAGAGGIGELIGHRGGRTRDRGDTERVARRDGKVVGAGLRAAFEALGPVETSRVVELGVLHPESPGGGVGHRRESLEIAADVFGHGVRGVVRGDDHQRMQRLIDRPGAAFLHVDLRRGLARSETADVQTRRRRPVFDRHERGQDLDGGRGEMWVVFAVGEQDGAGVGINEDV